MSVFFNLSSHYFLTQSPSKDLEFTDWLASPGILLSSPPPPMGFQVSTPVLDFYVGVEWGAQLLLLTSMYFTESSPLHVFSTCLFHDNM